MVIRTDTRPVNGELISLFTFCLSSHHLLLQSGCLNRPDGNAECVGNNFYNRTTNNGFEILRTQNNWPGAEEWPGGRRGNKILWTKDSLGADMNILI